jgi:hypothetical protein
VARLAGKIIRGGRRRRCLFLVVLGRAPVRRLLQMGE